MSKKRSREISTVDAQNVEIFEDLAHEREKVRLQAAHRLLSNLAIDNSPSAEQLEKTLKRLFRGLCSGRKAARLGFSVALTEFLKINANQDPDASEDNALSLRGIIKVWRELSKSSGNISGWEERDYSFGRLFGAEALFVSQIVVPPSIHTAALEAVLDTVLELSKKRIWLREECGWILYQLLVKLSNRPYGEAYCKVVIEKVDAHGLIKSLEGVLLWITALKLFPKIELPRRVFHQQDPLNKKEKTTLIRVLKANAVLDTTNDEQSEASTRSIWSSNLHFAWDILLSTLDDDDVPNRVQFAEVWTEAVDQGLFALTSSEERKFLGFLLLEKFVLKAHEDRFDLLFGNNLTRCLVNQLGSKERYLHSIAERMLNAISIRVSRTPEAISPILRAIMQTRGYVNFDGLTKTKTVDKMLLDAPLESLVDVFTLFSELLNRPPTMDENATETARRVLADHLTHLVPTKARLATSEQDGRILKGILGDILKQFTLYAYFDDRSPEQPRPSISEAGRDMFRSRIVSCLRDLMAKNTMTDVEDYPCLILRFIRDLVKDDRRHGISQLFSTQADPVIQSRIADAIDTTLQLYEKMAGSHEKDASYKAFIMLFSLTILQAYNGDPDAVSLLDEIQQSYESLLKQKSREGDAEGSEVLVEIILSLVSRPSLLFRRLAAQVFSAMASRINERGMQSVLAVLEAKETLSGQDELFEKEGEEEEEDFEMVDADASELNIEVDEDDSDVEVSIAGTDTPEESEDEEADREVEAELAAFDAKLAAALGTRRADDDLAVKDEESSDEDMNDEEMEALDAQIEIMFKERKRLAAPRKKEKKEAKKNIEQFKCRVLELLEVYVEEQPREQLTLSIIQPVLDLIRTTNNPQVREQSSELVRKYLKSYKLNPSPENSSVAISNEATVLFNLVHERAGLEGPNLYGSACSRASLLLAKVAVSNGAKIEWVFEQYAHTKRDLAGKWPPKLRETFFADWRNWCVSARQIYESKGLTFPSELE